MLKWAATSHALVGAPSGAAATGMHSQPYKPVALFPAGKTTLLRYLLENSKEKIACIVNDVAAINIDAKLVRNDRNRAREDQINTTADLADTIELANGCACKAWRQLSVWCFSCKLPSGMKRSSETQV